MNIFAQPGEQVIFTSPDAGLEQDIKDAKRYLSVGETYTVDGTEIRDWQTRVWLKGFSYCSFNSVQFGDV